MNSKVARKRIQTYVDGWKANNIDLICEPLAGNCLIIESHGPKYHGLTNVKEWVQSWIKGTYKVDKWNITSFYFTRNTAIFEWEFAFSSSKSPSREIDGISVVIFDTNKISSLREYRTTKPLYNWRKNKKLSTY